MPAYNAFIIASAIVRDGDRILLIEENRLGGRRLNTPGGRVRPYEAPRATAARKVREETGLDIRVRDLVAVIEGTWSDGGNYARFVYEAELLGGEERAEKDSVLHWVASEQLLRPESLPVPVMTMEEEMLKEYVTDKKRVTSYVYHHRDDQCERVDV